jgi:carbon storage regulator
MLVLKRKLNEEIKIDSNITVKILSISNGSVKIGITAPEDIQIYRMEIYEHVLNEMVEASKQSSKIVEDITKYKVNRLKNE